METYETIHDYNTHHQRIDKFMTISANSPNHSKNFGSNFQLNNTSTTMAQIDPKLRSMIQQRPSVNSQRSFHIRKKMSSKPPLSFNANLPIHLQQNSLSETPIDIFNFSGRPTESPKSLFQKSVLQDEKYDEVKKFINKPKTSLRTILGPESEQPKLIVKKLNKMYL